MSSAIESYRYLQELLPQSILSLDLRDSRLALKKGKSGFEPFHLWDRIFRYNFIPLNSILSVGDRILFAEHCRFDRCFISFIEENNQNYNAFPYGESLTILRLDQFDLIVTDEKKQIWKISQIVLTHVLDVSVKISN